MSDTLPNPQDKSVLARVLDALTTFGAAELESSAVPWDDAYVTSLVVKLTVARFTLAGAAPSPDQLSPLAALVAIACASDKPAVDDPLAVGVVSTADFVTQVCSSCPDRLEDAYRASAPKLIPIIVAISRSRWLRAGVADMDADSLEYAINLALRYVVFARLVTSMSPPTTVDSAVTRVDRFVSSFLTELAASTGVLEGGTSAAIDYSSTPYPNWRKSS